MGTITGISDLDPVRWPNSHWRTVQVSICVVIILMCVNVYDLSCNLPQSYDLQINHEGSKSEIIPLDMID